MRLHIITVFTHDSVFDSPEGPALAPVERLLSLRAARHDGAPARQTLTKPRQHGSSTAAATVALLLSQQTLPIIPETQTLAQEGVAHGAYILREAPRERIDLLLIASGSEVALALEAQRLL